MENNKYEFYLNILGIQTEEFNPNPKHNTEEKGVNDCTFRAYCKMLNKEWDEVFDEVTEICREEAVMYNSSTAAKIYLEKYGLMKHNPRKEEGIITVGEFMFKHKIGRYVIFTKTHAICYMDGIWYDKLGCLNQPDNYLIEHVGCVFY